MKLLQIIKEEIVPLSNREHLIILIIIASIFQFALFYAPAVAADASSKSNFLTNNEEIIKVSPISKEQNMDKEAAKLTTGIPIVGQIASQIVEASVSIPPVTEKTENNKDILPSDDKLASSSEKLLRTSTHVITAYNSEAAQTDDSPCITANGFNVCKHGKEDTIAANFLKFGTKVKIPELFGDRVFIVRDRMNKRHAERVDVWMVDRSDALHFGVKVAKIQVIE